VRSFEFERWDEGRLIVNRRFAPLLQQQGLITFDKLMHLQGGRVAKNLLPERTTTRFVLTSGKHDEQAFYIKRHEPSPWKEYVKPWFRLTRPILGARYEWNAILEFHKAGISTMTPVAVGRLGPRSLLVTESLEGCQKLSDWLQSRNRENRRTLHNSATRLIEAVARMTRAMHAAGLHHQDFYLNHLMVPTDDIHREVYVIDLGRARRRKQLSQRWLLKDLAQLNYSAELLSAGNRRRFLEVYLGRPLRRCDNGLIRRIQRKTQKIARHSRKNRL